MLVPRRSVFAPFSSSRAGHAALVRLLVLVAVPPDGEVQPLGQRVDDGHADPVQAARHLVAAAVAELAAGVEHGEHHLGGGLLLLGHRVDRDAAAVVRDGDGVVRMDDDLDLVGLAGQGLVDGVVDDLVDQVMEAAGAGRADVHARPLANGLEALQDRDVLGAVAAVPFALTLLGLLRQSVPSVQAGSRARRPAHHEKPRFRAFGSRTGAVHKTAPNTSRPPPRSGWPGYKMPANRNKIRALSDGSSPEPTINRRRSTRPPGTASSRRRARSTPSSSSSWAQTDDSHSTVTVPARSETGLAEAATAAPATAGQADWTSARRPAGRASGRASSRARPMGRGARRLMLGTPRTPARSTTPGRREARSVVRRPPHPHELAPRHTGHVLGLRRRHHRLASASQQPCEQHAAFRVELGHHVVEEHQRRAAAALRQELPLGEEQ